MLEEIITHQSWILQGTKCNIIKYFNSGQKPLHDAASTLLGCCCIGGLAIKMYKTMHYDEALNVYGGLSSVS